MSEYNATALKKLRKLYGYDIAVVKQRGIFTEDDQSELEALAMHHLDKQVVAAVNEFFGYVGDAEKMDAGAIAVIMGVCGVLLAGIHVNKSKKCAASAAKFGKKYLESRYLEILGEHK